jgi:hypothetical protein
LPAAVVVEPMVVSQQVAVDLVVVRQELLVTQVLW